MSNQLRDEPDSTIVVNDFGQQWIVVGASSEEEAKSRVTLVNAYWYGFTREGCPPEAAVEAGARALMESNGLNEEGSWDVPSMKDHYMERARAVLESAYRLPEGSN